MSRRVLFVDDEERAFRLWGKPLTRYGWEVDHALGPAEARQKLDAAAGQSESSYVAVIIDRHMPIPDRPESRDETVGDRFLEEVVARWWNVCPVMLTNYAHIDAAASATRYGAYRYLVKGEAMVEDIHHVLTKGVSSQSVRNDRYRCLAAPNTQVAVEEALKVLNSRYLQSLNLDIKPRFYRVLKGNELIRKRDDIEYQFGTTNVAQFEFGQLSTLLADQLTTQPFVFLSQSRDELHLKDLFSAVESRSQLLIPISVASGDDSPFERSMVGVLAIECPSDGGRGHSESTSFSGVPVFDREDIDILLTVAGWIRDVFTVESRLARVCSDAQSRERSGILQTIEQQLCEPLKIARHHLDILLTHIERDEIIPLNELHHRLNQSFVGCNTALQKAELLGLESQSLTLKPVDVDLVAIVTEQLNAIMLELEWMQVKSEIRLPRNSVSVHVDPFQLRRALETVLRSGLAALYERRNSMEDDDETGELTVLVEPMPGERQVLLSICDNGPRIDPRSVDRVFVRYGNVRRIWRSPSDFTNELHRVKEFIEASNGAIEVVPVAGDFGTEFRILLPIAGRQ